MNLAELRKKAQEEKKGSVVQPLLPPEAPEATEEVPPSIAEELPFDIDEVIPEVKIEAAVSDDPPGTEPAPRSGNPGAIFDPVAVLIAGRESVAWEEAGVAEEATAAGVSAEEIEEFLCFRVSSEVYAINILDIKEIIKPREVTEVPRVPSFVSGVLSLRGIIIPIFNMRLRLGLPGGEKSPKERIIVLTKGEDFFGILVDEVTQVVRIASATIEKPPAVLDGIDRDFVSGIGRFNGQMLILLNQEKILDLNLG